MLGPLLIILLLILANGFFVAAEIAIIAARKGRLEQMADEGSRGAKLAMELAEDPNRYLPTVQFGITLVNTFVAVFGGEELVTPLGDLIAQSPIPFSGPSCPLHFAGDCGRQHHVFVAALGRAGSQAVGACGKRKCWPALWRRC